MIIKKNKVRRKAAKKVERFRKEKKGGNGSRFLRSQSPPMGGTLAELLRVPAPIPLRLSLLLMSPSDRESKSSRHVLGVGCSDQEAGLSGNHQP